MPVAAWVKVGWDAALICSSDKKRQPLHTGGSEASFVCMRGTLRSRHSQSPVRYPTIYH